jgi:putative DNA primase/helicase
MPTLVPATNVPYALKYAMDGFYVLPTHSPRGGKCSCGKPLGKGAGQCQAKHPRIPAWPDQSSRDQEQILKWWKDWPDAGIGIDAGKSGFFVIDLDLPHGPGEWGELQDKYGDEGEPIVLRTGSGGYHLVYRHEEGITNSAAGLGAKNIDVRGTGGYIMAPPSWHWTGNQYQGDLEREKLQYAPRWAAGMLKHRVLPDAPAVRLEGAHPLTREDLERFCKYKAPWADAKASVQAAKALLAGGCWSDHGSRYVVMRDFLGALRTWVLDTHGAPLCPESMYPVFRESLAVVAALPDCQIPTTREWLLDLYSRLSVTDGAFRGRLEASRQRPDGSKLDLDAKDWILGTPAGYFLRGQDGSYVGPMMREFVVNKARDVLTSVPTCNEEGKELPLSVLMRRYGCSPEHTQYSYTIERSRYTKDTDTFVQKAGTPKVWVAEYHPQIARWLELFGGEKHEMLLDWLATLGELSRPTCALAVVGLSGAGKDLLMDGVSAIWGGRRTEFQRAIGTFNSSLVESPIVVANEGLRAPSRYDGSVMDALKEMVSSTSRPVEAKYARAVTLDGAVRVMIATNNTGSFHLDKQPNESDLQALNDRVLFIRPTEEARPFLEALGGREATEAWVAGGGLPRHVQWLQETRSVTRGLRFLVQGCGGLADILASQAAEPILAALLKVLLADRVLDGDNDHVACIRDGRVWVSQSNLKESWGRWSATKELPDDLGDAFKTITEAGSGMPITMKGHNNVKMRRVKLAVLRSHATRVGLEEELEVVLKKI